MCNSSTLFHATMMKLVIFVSVVVFVLYSQDVYSCPNRCACNKAFDCDGTRVICYNRGLSKVPITTDIPTDTCQLYLDNNNITTLRKGMFDELFNLRLLHLQSNQITMLPNGIFDHLTNLQFLYLGKNKISTIPSEIFNNMGNLERLHLNSNQISTISSETFKNMVNLQILSFRNNQISTIPNGIFKNMENLQELFLQNNQITTLRKKMFDRLKKLQRVVIFGNPLICNCDVFTFVQSANKTGLTFKSFPTDPRKTTCRTPEKIMNVLKVKGYLCDPELTTSNPETTTLTTSDSATTKLTTSDTATTNLTTYDPATTKIATSDAAITVPMIPMIIASLGVLLVLAVGVIVGILIKHKSRKHQVNNLFTMTSEPPQGE